jgi:hypothetical protein
MYLCTYIAGVVVSNSEIVGLTPVLPGFSLYNIPKREKYTKRTENTPNDHNTYIPNGRKQTKGPYNIPTLSISRLSKIYPKFGFWFENKPSGNPGCTKCVDIPLSIVMQIFSMTFYPYFRKNKKKFL